MWQVPAVAPEIDGAVPAAKVREHMVGVAQYCARKRVGPRDVGEMDWAPASDRPDETEVWPWSVLGKRQGGDTAQSGEDYGASDLRTGSSGP